MTDPTPAGDPTPPGADPGTNPPAAQGDPKPPTAEDIANLTKALEKERELRKARDRSSTSSRPSKASMTEAERASPRPANRLPPKSAPNTAPASPAPSTSPKPPNATPATTSPRVLDDINLARFIGDDGEPDSKAIAASVARLIPEATATGPAQPPVVRRRGAHHRTRRTRT
jgi:hypothetical protein